MIYAILAIFLAMMGIAIMVAPFIPGNKFAKGAVGIILIIIAIAIVAWDYNWTVML